MVKPKSQSKKQQKRGVDFKKIKRKLGRKLPPPKNTTNTEVKSKTIVLREQSIASEKAGLAVSKRGLTLMELLQKTSHHSSKVRKDALVGIKDLIVNHPAELKQHKFAVIEKLRERIGDDDKLVRDTLYQLFKSVILPGSKEENQGPIVSLMMAYIFNSMTHLAIEVRLMAFKFLDLSVEYHPSSFSLHAEKILENYVDILRRNQFLEDKGKLKSIVAGLGHCLSLLPCNRREDQLSIKNDAPANDILHAYDPDTDSVPLGQRGLTNIIMKLKDLLPILVSCFLDFKALIHSNALLDSQSSDCMQFILESIDLAVKYLIYENFENESDRKSILPLPNHDTSVNDKQCFSPRILKKLWDAFPLNSKDDGRIAMLNTIITRIFFQFNDWNCAATFSDKFLMFFESSLFTKLQSGKVFRDKHLLALIPCIPKLTTQISSGWRSRILQAFTELFRNCNVESSTTLTCVSVIEEMLDIDHEVDDPLFLDYQMAWVENIPSLLILWDNKNPLCSKVLLALQLRLAQTAPVNSPVFQQIDNMQYNWRGFYSDQASEVICHGPFVRLAADIQELAICCLYYFSFVDPLLLQSLIQCCLYDKIEPHILFRILEVLHSAFRAGHIQLADYVSFHVTLLSRFQVYPEETSPAANNDGKPNRKTFNSLTRTVCSYLSQIGDDFIIFQMLEKFIISQICDKLALDNKCAFFRLLISLDSKPTRLSEQSIAKIGLVLPQYLIHISLKFEDDNETSHPTEANRKQYYILPTFFLFQRSEKLLKLVLDEMETWVSEICSAFGAWNRLPQVNGSTMTCSVLSLILSMYKDAKIRRLLSSYRIQIQALIQNLLNLMSSRETTLTLEERLKIESTCNRVKAMLDLPE